MRVRFFGLPRSTPGFTNFAAVRSRAEISDPSYLASSIRKGDRRALARALTLVENRAAGHDALIDELYPDVGSAWRIGLTGPPGVGKSTLSGRLIETLVGRGEKVAYLGIDPTSPFSGGAVLGDRIRLDAIPRDEVFLRSAATRGARGGLSVRADALADVLDAAGFDTVVVETVGVGQADVDIARIVDTVIVVLVPESGDEIQAMKAGLLEIANVLCVNKADRASADTLYSTLRQAVRMQSSTRRGRPAIAQSIALEPGGADELVEAVLRHRDELKASGEWSAMRDERLRQRIETIVRSLWEERFWTPARSNLLRSAVDSMETEGRKPYSLASLIIEAEESEAEAEESETEAGDSETEAGESE